MEQLPITVQSTTRSQLSAAQVTSVEWALVVQWSIRDSDAITLKVVLAPFDHPLRHWKVEVFP
jgi:hypothetical protein